MFEVKGRGAVVTFEQPARLIKGDQTFQPQPPKTGAAFIQSRELVTA